MSASDCRPARRAAAFIGARLFVDNGRYFTDSSLVYELVALAQQFDEFTLHCFVIANEDARDELHLPANVRLQSLGKVRSGRELYGHPLRLLRRIAASERNGDWRYVVLAEPGLVSALAFLVSGLHQRQIVALVRGDPAVGEIAHRHRHGMGALTGWALRRFRVLVCEILARRVPVITDSDIVAIRLSKRGGRAHLVAAASVSEKEILPPGPQWQGSGSLRLLFVGRLELVKDLGTLIDALSLVHITGYPCLLQIVGSGDCEYEALLRAQVRRRGLAGWVEFVGPVPHGPELYRYYQQAHVFVLSSRSEGIPKAVIEAMAHGLPVVATRVGGLPGLVTPDVGVLVSPGDTAALSRSLIMIHQSPELAHSMGRAGQSRTARLLAEPVSRDLASVITSEAREPWPGVRPRRGSAVTCAPHPPTAPCRCRCRSRS